MICRLCGMKYQALGCPLCEKCITCKEVVVIGGVAVHTCFYQPKIMSDYEMTFRGIKG